MPIPHPASVKVALGTSDKNYFQNYLFQAAWEDLNDEEEQLKDWSEFANVVGYKEIRRLETRDIQYRISPPGVKFVINL